MSHKGYGLEHWVEDYFLKKTGKTLKDSIFTRTFRVPASGAMASLKGDVRTKIPGLRDMNVECKDRKQSSKKLGRVFRLPRAWLDKHEAECAAENLLFLFAIAFKGTMDNKNHIIFNQESFDYFVLNKPETTTIFFEAKRKSLVLVKSILDKGRGDFWLIADEKSRKSWYLTNWENFNILLTGKMGRVV